MGSNPTPTDSPCRASCGTPGHTPVRLAYNTNGLAHHRLEDALGLLADCGYDGVALTLDHAHLDPFAPDLTGRTQALAKRLHQLGLGSVIETGARYLLDPSTKHEPTLVSAEAAGRARRIEFLQRAIEIAGTCGSEAVSFWAGTMSPDLDSGTAWDWLVEGVAQVAEAARTAGVVAAFEPEPDMLVETVDDYERLVADLAQRTDAPLQLALDVGHCTVTGDREPAAAVRECAASLGTVSIEDMRHGVHRHLPFGEGDVDVPAVCSALSEVRWSGLVCIELSRDSHRGAEMVRRSIEWLQQHALGSDGDRAP